MRNQQYQLQQQNRARTSKGTIIHRLTAIVGD
jgi:hypothetical protein